jgi:UDP-N-acetylglucosamine 2-epimerase
MKVLTVVGARPQFIKAAAVSRALRPRHQEFLLHTGQHYDHEMSEVFFEGLEIPRPDVNLAVGSGTHGAQTGAMLKAIEEILIAERPDWLLAYGDTNSTLAAALAASKTGTPIAHVEAGLRSFNRRMPEEVNRVVTDHLSDLLLCPSRTAVRNLAAEGIWQDVHVVGDVMLDVLNWALLRRATQPSPILESLHLAGKSYLLATVHRAENTDGLDRFTAIIDGLNRLDETVVFPIHPRVRRVLAASNVRLAPHVHPIDPLGYVDMITLAQSARMILTDSGGLQKEAYWLGVPCLTLRDETEWVETVETGWNRLVGSDPELIVNGVRWFAPISARPALYGDGCAAAACVKLLSQGTGQPKPARATGSPVRERIDAEIFSN